MRKILPIAIIVLILCLLFSARPEAQLDGEQTQEEAKGIELRGIIIDNLSAEKYLNQLNTFAPRYPKAQAMYPVSVESGYSIYTQEGELYRFNKKSNDKIYEFLQNRNNVVRVVVKAKEDFDADEGDLELISINNQYTGARGQEN